MVYPLHNLVGDIHAVCIIEKCRLVLNAGKLLFLDVRGEDLVDQFQHRAEPLTFFLADILAQLLLLLGLGL